MIRPNGGIIFSCTALRDRPLVGWTVDEMYLASLINKGKAAYERGTTDPTALPADTLLQMATINGAKTVLWADEIGSLEVGKKVSTCNHAPFT